MLEVLIRKSETSDSGSKSESSTAKKIPIVQPVQYVPSTGRQVKMDFPRFDGNDALQWIFKAEQYFKFYEVVESQRLIIASVHLDGEVLPWFQMMERSRQILTWTALIRAVEEQYGPSQFDCALSQLFKLTQQGELDIYHTKFTELANRTEELTESALLDCYLGGLKPDLRCAVLVHKPTTVLKAMALAKLFGEVAGHGISNKIPSAGRSSVLSTQNKTLVPYVGARTGTVTTSSGGGKTNLPSLLPTPNMPPIKKMTPAEMLIRREKGLCYTCDEKFSPNHKCPNKQLMLL